MRPWIRYGLLGQVNKATAVIFIGIATMAQAEPVDILALGDSLTQGYGLVEAEGFVPQLREWLTEQGHDVTLVNAGVSGDTTAGGLARVEWSLTPETDAMIVALGGNDLLRGLSPEQARKNIEGILQIATERQIEVLLVGMQAPGNYGPEYKAAFDALYPDLSQAYDTLYQQSFFDGLAPQGATPASVADLMQPDGIHPNAKGVARIVSSMGPRVEELVARVLD